MNSASPLLRQLGLQALERVAGSSLGRRAIQAAIRRDPSLAFETLGPVVNRPARFDTVPAWPERVDAFEDLAFLFSSNPLNWGIALLTFDEASYLYGLARAGRAEAAAAGAADATGVELDAGVDAAAAEETRPLPLPAASAAATSSAATTSRPPGTPPIAPPSSTA